MARKFGPKRTAVAKSAKNRAGKYKARWSRKSRGGSAKPATVKIQTKGIPDKMLVKLTYGDLQSISSSVNTYASKDYYINSVWDPESGALNSSAYGLSQYANIYQRFRVYAVSYDIDMIATSGSTSTVAYVNFAPFGENPSGSNMNQLSARFTRSKLVKLVPQGQVRFKGKMSIPKLFGLTSEQYRTNDKYSGSTSSNVAMTLAVMRVGCLNVANAPAAGLQGVVRLTYHVELFDRVDALTTSAPTVDQGGISTE